MIYDYVLASRCIAKPYTLAYRCKIICTLNLVPAIVWPGNTVPFYRYYRTADVTSATSTTTITATTTCSKVWLITI